MMICCIAYIIKLCNTHIYMNPFFSLHDYPYCGVSNMMANVYTIEYIVVVYPHDQFMMYFCVNYTIRLGVLISCIVSSCES